MKSEKYYIAYSSNPVLIGNDLVLTVNLEDVNNLALLAIQLDYEPTLRKYPQAGVSETTAYAAALYEYIKQNPAHPMYENFDKIYSAHRLLGVHIDLCLLEKKHRAEGITNQSMERYNRVQSEYNKILAYNKSEFAELIEQELTNNYKKQ